MRHLTFLLLMLLSLTACRSNRQLMTESSTSSIAETNIRSDTRSTAKVSGIYSAATTIELTDITIGLSPDHVAGAGKMDTTANPVRASHMTAVHIARATISSSTAAEKHLQVDSTSELSADLRSDTSSGSVQQSKSETKAQTAPVTSVFWLLCAILLIAGWIYVRRINSK